MPAEHFGPIDEYGMRTDYAVNPQYFYGAYEYNMDPEFIGTKPSLPSVIFALDVSSTAIISGFFNQVINTIKASLDYF